MTLESILTIIFSALVAISTVVYAFLTRRLVNETIKLRKAQTEPKISIRIEPSENCMFYCDMIIENIGLGPAYDINFKLDTDIIDYHKKSFRDIRILKDLKILLFSNKYFHFCFFCLKEPAAELHGLFCIEILA